MPDCRIRTLGEFSVSVGGSALVPPSTQKARAVLTYLALNRRRDISREGLIEVFWPEADPERARGNLKTALWAIRRTLRNAKIDPNAYIDANKSTVRWLGDTSVDLEDFSNAVDSREIAGARRAVDAYKGEFLEGSFDDWTAAERERAAALYEKALARVLAADPNVGLAQRLIERNPYDEAAYSVIIADAVATNRPLVAATMVDRCRKALAEVGAAPSDEFEKRFGSLRLPRAQSSRAAFPFVGRAAELDAVHGVLERALQGLGSLTIVSGDAGIGKSSLLRVALGSAADRTRTLLSHWVRCAPSDPRALGPWLQFAAELTEKSISDLLPERGDVSEAIATAVLAGFTMPAAIVIDDAQYLTGDAFDTATKIIVKAVARHSVLVVTRPEALDRLRRAFGPTSYEEIALGCLGRNEVEAGAAQATGEFSTQLVDALYARTDGHPLFIANIWEMSYGAKIDFDKVPAKLQRFLDLRLRSRGPDAHAVAVALAIEPTASADVLADALGFSEERTLDALDDLLALGIVVQPRTGPPFRIAHDLIAEVASASFHRGRLTVLHREFARALEGRIETGTTLRRARHLRDCGQWVAAEKAYDESASEALEWRAYGDAIRYSTEAIDALRTLRRTRERDIALSSAHRMVWYASMLAGAFDVADGALSHCVAHARAAGDSPSLLQALLARATFDSQRLGFDKDRLLAADEAAAIADQLHQRDALGIAHAHRCAALRNLGRVEEALAAADLAESFAEQLSIRHPEYFGEILITRMAAWRFSDAARMLALIRRHVAADNLEAETEYRYNRGYLRMLMLAPDKGGEEANRIIHMSREWLGMQQARDSKGHFGTHIVQSLYTAYALLGLTHVKMRRWDRAVECAASMYQSAPNLRELPLFHDLWLLLQVDAHLGRGGTDDVAIAQRMIGELRQDLLAANVGLRMHGPLELLQARLAVRLADAEAPVLLERAYAALEDGAAGLFLFVDDWFLQLDEAARLASRDDIAGRAGERYIFWHARRVKATEGVVVP